MSQSQPSVLVIGGGAAGMSVALHLAWQGASVRILEAGVLAGGCSQLGGGWVAAQGRRNLSQLAFALDSIAYYPEMIERIGVDAGLRPVGSLLLLETDEQVEQRRQFLADQMRLPGYDGFEFLDLKQLTALEPNIRSPHVIAGTWRAGDITVDPPALMDALRKGITDAGVAITEGAQVEGIERTATGWTVRTVVGDFTADAVVDAAGPNTAAVARMAGIELPLDVVTGQILRTAPQPFYVKALIVAMHNHHLGDCPARDLRQAHDGRLWIGTVNHPGQTHAEVTRADTDLIRKHMSRLFPELADIVFERGYCGTRPIAADGLPTYGAVGDGFYVAAPMSGIAEAAVAGRTMAELIVSGASAALPEAFSPRRLLA